MSGLFHLQPVAKLSKHRETALEGMLGKAIRKCSSQVCDRNIPLEDFYHEVLSHWQTRDDVFLVRFAAVNDKGQPFGSVSEVQTLHDVTVALLRTKVKIFTPDEQPDKYDHFYTPAQFEDTHFLWVPNNKWVHTLVASYRV